MIITFYQSGKIQRLATEVRSLPQSIVVGQLTILPTTDGEDAEGIIRKIEQTPQGYDVHLAPLPLAYIKGKEKAKKAAAKSKAGAGAKLKAKKRKK